MRPTIYRRRCPLGDDECPQILTLTVTPGCRATRLDPAEPPQISAEGCPHVSDASGWEWNRPGGIAERLWSLVDEMDLDAWDAEIDRRIHAAREG